MTGSLALVSDLDGTIVDLPVPWHELRRRLGVRTIAQLWDHGLEGGWELVADAEESAAQIAPLREVTLRWIGGLDPSVRLAILTDNSRRAAEAVMARSQVLASRCAGVVGREDLTGPKRDPSIFAAGLERCLSMVGSPAEGAVYLGDSDYELRLAQAAGLKTMAVGTLPASR